MSAAALSQRLHAPPAREGSSRAIGDKRTQSADIETALRLARNL